MYDLIILGAGPAGLSASIYAIRYKLKVLIIGQVFGGTIGQAHYIENYPGTGKISGIELGEKMLNQTKELGTEVLLGKVEDIKKNKNIFEVTVSNKKFQAKRILIAIGCERTKLQIPGEEKLTGKGVSYCATCDGFFFRNKSVAVIGGGDSAVTAAIYLSSVAQKVYLIYRGKYLKAEPHWIHQLEKLDNVDIRTDNSLTKIKGEEKVEKIILDDGSEISIDGVFIEIGSAPNQTIFANLGVQRDSQGYIHVDSEYRTNIRGIWAAGDITFREPKLRQVITAAAEGAIAAYSIFLNSKKEA